MTKSSKGLCVLTLVVLNIPPCSLIELDLSWLILGESTLGGLPTDSFLLGTALGSGTWRSSEAMELHSLG